MHTAEKERSTMRDYLGKDTYKLGFGLMRLPKREDGHIDVEQVKTMADQFIAAGGTYFDTAFVYDGGESEAAFKAAVADRYPRSAYTVATKLHAAAAGCKDEKTAKEQFYTSLTRTGAGYFDYYLLHAIQRTTYRKYDEYHLWDFVKEQKEKGLIRHIGFSFHADPALLETLLDAHPETEFVQLQINYADWDNPGVASRRNWEICRAYGKPVVVMEPVKGGILADPIPAVKEALDQAGRGWSYPGWALRFVLSQEGLLTVLSGMSSIAQMEDNLSTLRDFAPLDEETLSYIKKAQAALDADKSIPCTACHYCSEGCPAGIAIPEIFNVVNRSKGSPQFRVVREYTIVTLDKGKAGDCLECGQCENVCPQHLPVMKLLKDCRKLEE